MPKIAGKIICPHCGISNTTCLGGTHYVKTGEGFGHEKIEIGYQCNDCSGVWHE
jgi:hypothetical protein